MYELSVIIAHHHFSVFLRWKMASYSNSFLTHKGFNGMKKKKTHTHDQNGTILSTLIKINKLRSHRYIYGRSVGRSLILLAKRTDKLQKKKRLIHFVHLLSCPIQFQCVTDKTSGDCTAWLCPTLDTDVCVCVYVDKDGVWRGKNGTGKMANV